MAAARVRFVAYLLHPSSFPYGSSVAVYPHGKTISPILSVSSITPSKI